MKTIQLPSAALAQALGVKDVYLKREDQHKYGSQKGRSLPVMVKKYFKENGRTKFVISSSGNAALAAIHAVQVHNRNNPSVLKLKIFVGQKISPHKLKLLLSTINDANISLEQVDQARRTAQQFAQTNDYQNLRQSNDDTALLGYFELAQELDKIANLGAIFIPTSSGTTAQGLGEAFLSGQLSTHPQIHIVQTTACHPLAKDLCPYSVTPTPASLANAIVDNIGLRKNRLTEIINQTQGGAWIVTDEEIKKAQELVKETCNLVISPNSALAIAGLKKARECGREFPQPICCLITGL